MALRRGAWLALCGFAVVGIMVVADVSLTWIHYRSRIAVLADSVPGPTAYMLRRAKEGHPPIHRRWVQLDSLPLPLVCAVVASENANYFITGTLDWSNQRAMMTRVLRGDLSRGGSGITQQLARNLFLTPDRTPRRKLREYVLAFQLSHTLTKERQLELYLNLVEWGNGVWGIAAASDHFFDRPPARLTPSEMLLLANVLPAPSQGLGFPISPPRRAKLVHITDLLWRAAVLDDLTWTATVARLQRIGDFVDAGMTPAVAARATTAEMGPERPAEPEASAPSVPLGQRCNFTRRGVT